MTDAKLFDAIQAANAARVLVTTIEKTAPTMRDFGHVGEFRIVNAAFLSRLARAEALARELEIIAKALTPKDSQ